MCTCWSSGVQMPHVIWLSRLISEDQCLCPLTEPTSTKPSRYAISAWVPSCDQVKSLTWRKEMFPFKTCVHIYRMQPAKLSAGIYWRSILDVLYNIICNLYFQFFQGTVAQYSCHMITGKKHLLYLGSSVVHQLYRPSSFILDPHKNTTFHITCGQLLKGFIPSHQDNLQKPRIIDFSQTSLAFRTKKDIYE